jgi:hypothetical protein
MYKLFLTIILFLNFGYGGNQISERIQIHENKKKMITFIKETLKNTSTKEEFIKTIRTKYTTKHGCDIFDVAEEFMFHELHQEDIREKIFMNMLHIL